MMRAQKLLGRAATLVRTQQSASKSPSLAIIARWHRHNSTAAVAAGPATLKILFGSQTGTAQGFAEALGDEARRRSVPCEVVDLAEYTPSDLLKERSVVLVTACYGEGEPTDSAKDFVQWVSTTADKMPTDLKYSVFGLGSSKCFAERYQAVGRLLDRRLEELGASRIASRGEGDDAGNIETDFEKWQADFWQKFESQVAKTPSAAKTSATESKDGLAESPRKYNVTVTGGTPISLRTFPASNMSGTDPSNPTVVPVTVNRELCDPRSKLSCRHIELNTTGTAMKYETGDHVAFYPENDPALVHEIGELTCSDLDANYTFSPVDAGVKAPFPNPCSARNVLSRFLDISRAPLPQTIRALAAHAQQRRPAEAAELLALAKDKYASDVKGNMLNVVDLMRRFPSARPPLAALIEALPRVHPRYYSISSSPLVHPDSMHVTPKVAEWTGGFPGMTSLRRGVCSGYMATLKPGDEACVFMRTSKFHLPKDDSTPIIMVGAGAGLAPFRAFLEERTYRAKKDGRFGHSRLYFGTRTPHSRMYADEIADAVNSGALTQYHEAFSHVPNGALLVHEKFIADADDIWGLLNKGAVIYVCGGANGFGTAMTAAFQRLFVTHGGAATETDAVARVADAMSRGRWLEDLAD